MSESQQKVMDVVFLIDATGSMSATIKAAHDKAAEIAISLRVNNPEVNFKFGSVCYRDPIDSPTDIHQIHQLDTEIDTLVTFFSTVQASGGGDGPEDWVGGYNLVLNKMEWRSGPKTIIHIADAPAHGQLYCNSINHEEESSKLEPLIEIVAKRGILMSCIDINCGALNSFKVCQNIYEQAGGCGFTIESLSLNGMYGERSSTESHGRMEVCICEDDDGICCDCDVLFGSDSDHSDGDDEGDGNARDDGNDEIGRALHDCTHVACTQALKMFYV
jgi:hypothetical protein